MKGFLFFDPLKGLDFIVHGFSTKHQGFGSAEKALNGLGLKGMASVVPKQVHGTDFVVVKDGRAPVRPPGREGGGLRADLPGGPSNPGHRNGPCRLAGGLPGDRRADGPEDAAGIRNGPRGARGGARAFDPEMLLRGRGGRGAPVSRINAQAKRKEVAS